MIGEATIITLRILDKFDVVRPSQFARLYFPKDHKGWMQGQTCGRNASGIQKGACLNLWAGSWLAKLENRGLITRPHEGACKLTNDGLRILNEDR